MFVCDTKWIVCRVHFHDATDPAILRGAVASAYSPELHDVETATMTRGQCHMYVGAAAELRTKSAPVRAVAKQRAVPPASGRRFERRGDRSSWRWTDRHNWLARGATDELRGRGITTVNGGRYTGVRHATAVFSYVDSVGRALVARLTRGNNRLDGTRQPGVHVRRARYAVLGGGR